MSVCACVGAGVSQRRLSRGVRDRPAPPPPRRALCADAALPERFRPRPPRVEVGLSTTKAVPPDGYPDVMSWVPCDPTANASNLSWAANLTLGPCAPDAAGAFDALLEGCANVTARLLRREPPGCGPACAEAVLAVVQTCEYQVPPPLSERGSRGAAVRGGAPCAVRKVGYFGPGSPDGQGDRRNCCAPIHRATQIRTPPPVRDVQHLGNQSLIVWQL